MKVLTKRNVLLLGLLTLVFALTTVFSVIPNHVYASSKINKVIFIVDSQEAYDNILKSQEEVEAELDEDLFEIHIADNISFDLTSYRAVALPYSSEEIFNTADIYETNTIVYFYGNLTINDYKTAVGIENFSLDVNVINPDAYSDSKATQYFDEEYENSEIYNIISFSNRPLLCKVYNETDSDYIYLYNIVNDFSASYNSIVPFSTIVESGFGFSTSWNPAGVICTAYMDYTLYRNYNEEDPTYDYFGITTNVWVTKSNSNGRLTGLNTKYQITSSIDELLETGPASQSNIGTLSVSVGYGSSGPSGSIGYSMNLSDHRPTIKRTENYTTDTVEWKLHKRFWFPPRIDGVTQRCTATWASWGSSLAAIDLYYQGIVNIGPSQQYPTSAGYTHVPVRFYY